jgi:hypothetical protein
MKKVVKEISIGVFVLVVAALVTYYGFGIGKENQGSTISSVGQSGGITAQNVTIDSYQPVVAVPTSTATVEGEASKVGVLPRSVFSLLGEMRESSSTSLERGEIFEKHVGLATEGEGYVLNVHKISESEVWVSITDTEDKDSPVFSYLVCSFSNGWEKAAAPLGIGQKVRFFGIIDSLAFSSDIHLKKCELR